MVSTKLNIGKIPISKGEYQEGIAYQRLNQVTMLGSTYQSKIDDNTSAPAQMGADGAVENINTDKWLCIAVGNISSAKKVVYNNETSGLEAGNVQEAIDEVGSKVSDLSKTKDAVSSFVTKTDSLTKKANQSIVFMFTHLYFKKGARFQLVIENPNGDVAELLQISAYSIEEDNKVEVGHYVAIKVSYKTIEDNKFVLNIVFPADGYLFFNWGGTSIVGNDTLTCRYTVYGSLSQGLEDAGNVLEKTRNEISHIVSAVPIIQEEVKKATDTSSIDKWTHLYFLKGTRLHLEVATIIGNISDLVQMSVYSVKTDGNLDDGYETIIEGFNDIKNGKYIIDVEYPKDGYLFFNLGHNYSLVGKEITIKYAVYATISQNAVKQELFSTKDAICSFITKSETKKKESEQEIVFFWTHLFFKKDTRLQLVVENPNGNVSELIQTSVYSVKEDGLLSSGYAKIVEGFKTITDNKFIVNIIYPADGYLMLNWGGISIKDNDTLTAKYTLYGSLSQEVSNLNTKVEGLNTKVEELSVTKELDNIQKAISVLHNINRLDVLSPVNDNVYINVVGDSIMAFQSTSELPDEGVTNVPPTCDKMANCYYLWKAISWGDCEYARFDKGKKSLVGKWDDTISDDTNAFFIESGTFKTEYIGAVMREKFPQIDGVQVSTIIDAKSFPYQFDESENGWWQRNIPKRFSNEANASISFTIPKGYKYFDLLYHANIHGDNNVSISVQNSKTVKICNNYEKNFAEKESLSSYTLDTSYTPTGDHDDKFGIPNQRLHFKIDDVSSDTTVKITKSSDTSKYFIYWGVSFWGTNVNPYCLQINNMAIGGYGTNSVDAIRESLFKGTYCDGVILEVCANTVCSKSNVLDNIKTYFSNYKMCFNKTSPFTINLDTVGVWIPHLWNQNFESADLKAVSYINNKGACKVVRDLGYNLLFNVQNIFDSVRLLYSPDMSEKDFINQYDPGNGVHLRNNGYKLYYPAWQVSSGKL